jgi:hypothetical protein
LYSHHGTRFLIHLITSAIGSGTNDSADIMGHRTPHYFRRPVTNLRNPKSQPEELNEMDHCPPKRYSTPRSHTLEDSANGLISKAQED